MLYTFEQAYQLANAYWEFMEDFNGNGIGVTNRYNVFETTRYIMKNGTCELEKKMVECTTCCTSEDVVGYLLADFAEFRACLSDDKADIPVMSEKESNAFEWDMGLCGHHKAEWKPEEDEAELIEELELDLS